MPEAIQNQSRTFGIKSTITASGLPNTATAVSLLAILRDPGNSQDGFYWDDNAGAWVVGKPIFGDLHSATHNEGAVWDVTPPDAFFNVPTGAQIDCSLVSTADELAETTSSEIVEVIVKSQHEPVISVENLGMSSRAVLALRHEDEVIANGGSTTVVMAAPLRAGANVVTWRRVVGRVKYDQPGSVSIEESADGSDWDVVKSLAFVAGVFTDVSVELKMPHVRAVVSNTGGAPTAATTAHLYLDPSPRT